MRKTRNKATDKYPLGNCQKCGEKVGRKEGLLCDDCVKELNDTRFKILNKNKRKEYNA